MADAATIRDDQVVVELGPGTGVVTEALLAKGVSPDRLLLIELSPDFARFLQAKFPGVRVVQGDAFTLKQVVAKHVGKRRSVGAVVSSLPLFVYTKEQRISLLEQALDAVGPAGKVVQFTYSTISPFPFEAEKVKTTVTRRIWWNLWPVVVWTYQRK
jgi:phosphatidylethanolamine/phosphatidyl-N-methylethanolamine N-methyltransferase